MIGIHKIKHGDCGKRIYGIYTGIKQRCECKTCNIYKYYGGRGISICEEWNDYVAFRDWSYANGYEEHLTIDRIDVNGNYEPSNCKWSTWKEQGNNRRDNRTIEIDGECHTVAEWVSITGICYPTLSSRIQKGETGKNLIRKPDIKYSHNTPEKHRLLKELLDTEAIENSRLDY